MNRIILCLLMAMSFNLMGCNVSVDGGLDVSDDSDPGKVDKKEDKKKPFKFDLNVNGTPLNALALAFPKVNAANGKKYYQLRFFDKFDTSEKVCDDFLMASETSKFDNLLIANVSSEVGKQEFISGRNFDTYNSGSIAGKPFNMYWDALGSYEITEVGEFNIRGKISANDYYKKKQVNGQFEAYICGSDGEKGLAKTVQKNLLGSKQTITVKEEGTGKFVDLTFSVADESSLFRIESRKVQGNYDEELQFSTSYVELKAGHIVSYCGSEEAVLGKITPDSIQYSAASKDCFNSYDTPPRELSLKKVNGVVTIKFVTFSGRKFSGTWKVD